MCRPGIGLHRTISWQGQPLKGMPLGFFGPGQTLKEGTEGCKYERKGGQSRIGLGGYGLGKVRLG